MKRKVHRVFYIFQPFFIADERLRWEAVYYSDTKEWSISKMRWIKNIGHYQGGDVNLSLKEIKNIFLTNMKSFVAAYEKAPIGLNYANPIFRKRYD